MSAPPSTETLIAAICAYCERPRSEHQFRTPCPAPDTELGSQVRLAVEESLAAVGGLAALRAKS